MRAQVAPLHLRSLPVCTDDEFSPSDPPLTRGLVLLAALVVLCGLVLAASVAEAWVR